MITGLSILFASCLYAQVVVPEVEGEYEEVVEAQSNRTSSSDQRIVVFGRDVATRAAVLSQITALRDELSFVLNSVKEGEKSRRIYALQNDLVVVLAGEPGDPEVANPFVFRFYQVEGSPRMRIELNIHLARGLDRKRLREVALECILLDGSLSAEIRAEQEVQVAPWIMAGLLERMAWRKGEGDRGLYKALFKNGFMLEMDELVTLKNPSQLDAAQRTAFRVSAGALAMTLLGEEGGKDSFRDYLSEQPVNEGEPTLLFRRHFFGTTLKESSYAKWWALQLQNLTQDFVTQTLNITETEEALTEVLRGELEGEEGVAQSYRLVAYQDIVELEEKPRKILLDKMRERLGLLRYRCFPSYRAMLAEYLRIIAQLEKGEDTEGVAERLAIIEEERQLFRDVGIRTRDYIDWYQITNATELTGDFREYQELKKRLETESAPHPGPLDEYLEQVQSLYEE